VPIVQQGFAYDLTTWFSSPYNTSLTYTLYSNGGATTASISNSGSYVFTADTGSYIYIKVNDPLVPGGCTQQTGDIQVQAAVSLTMDTPTSDYYFTSGGQGPSTSTLVNRFFPDAPGDRDYKYYGAPFTGSLYTTQSNTLPTASGNYNVYVAVPADIYYPAITSSILPFTIYKNVLTIKANNRLVAFATGAAFVTDSVNNSYTVTNLQGGPTGDTDAVITGTVTYTTNYTDTTPSGSTGVYIRPVVTGLSAVNYTFIGEDGVVTIGDTVYNPTDYSADDYQIN
jgi:hypothetical protein